VQVRALDDVRVLADLADEAKDEATAVEAAGLLTTIEEAVSKMEFARMLSGPYDRQGAIVSINAGAGGTESQDWAEMLQRCTRAGARRGYKSEIPGPATGRRGGHQERHPGVRGRLGHGYLRAESGVHRLVRISPFDAQARRHTSFASVFVYPDIDETVKVDIGRERPTCGNHALGAGRAASTSTRPSPPFASRTFPTGIAVHCQQERSQHKNRSHCHAHPAFEVDRGRAEEDGREDGRHPCAEKGDRMGQPDSLVCSGPYRLASDHRTGLKVGNVDAVLDGDLDQFMVALLLQMAGDPSARLCQAGPIDDLDEKLH